MSALIVDDHPAVRRILSAALTRSGVSVAAASCAAEAIKILEQRSFDVALIDAQVAEVSGFALAGRIYQQWPKRNTKLVMLTSPGQGDVPKQLAKDVIFAQLSKPVKLPELFKLIGRVAALPIEEVPARTLCPDDARQSVGASLRILVADDNLINRKVAERMLQRLGHSVSLAGNGKEAIASIQTRCFDLVMMDIQMPDMDGLEVTRQIRAGEAGAARVPIIALTAHATDSHREQCLQAGMDSFLTKPIVMESLKLELEWVLKRMRADAFASPLKTAAEADFEIDEAWVPVPGIPASYSLSN